MNTATLAAPSTASLSQANAIESPIASTATAPKATAHPAQRLARKYMFNDADMDLFFMAALGWGPSGGLNIGQAYYVAAQITDGDSESWVRAFSSYAQTLERQARDWQARGRVRAAGEMHLQAFATWRSAWQFATPGAAFDALYARHQIAFRAAMQALQLPATFFEVPYAGRQLPGVFLRNARADAPVALVIGGADTCYEDLFLTIGRSLLERGYSVALVDLPGQGNTMTQGLHWEARAERPIAAVIDVLIERFGARPGRIGLVGLSLGGYFVARAAGHESRIATVVASTPFPSPAELFALSVRAGQAAHAAAPHIAPSAATQRSRQMSLWKAGARDAQDFIARSAAMVADPALVHLPFLSILGAGDSPVFAAQARAWHEAIQSERKEFVLLDAASGADGHVQVNNRTRLAQEVSGWLDEVFA